MKTFQKRRTAVIISSMSPHCIVQSGSAVLHPRALVSFEVIARRDDSYEFVAKLDDADKFSTLLIVDDMVQDFPFCM